MSHSGVTENLKVDMGREGGRRREMEREKEKDESFEDTFIFMKSP